MTIYNVLSKILLMIWGNIKFNFAKKLKSVLRTKINKIILIFTELS